jgi:hypothetical protein
MILRYILAKLIGAMLRIGFWTGAEHLVLLPEISVYNQTVLITVAARSKA